MGLWREGCGSPAKSKAHGLKIGSWVCRSAKSKAGSGLSLSLSFSLHVSMEMV